ncbi:MAG: hypothetical protein PHW04_13305 [Candidatus Wallbacteria bacterium]|nr:hypothetical protein [Candidatus Wallbacteria bacterium]
MPDFKSIAAPFSQRVILVYFDLRKFSYIEKNFDCTGIYQELNRMHETICDLVAVEDGFCIRFIGDNTMVLFDSSRLEKLPDLLHKIKSSVDGYFRDKGFPCGLHVLAHIGNGNIGMLGGREKKSIDVSGDVLNLIGYCIFLVDSSDNKELFNGFVVSADFHQALPAPEREKFREIEVQSKKMYLFT